MRNFRLKSLSLKRCLKIVLCICIALASSVLLQGQQSAPPSPPAAQGYPVTVEGHEAFQIFEPLGPISAHDRAQRASARLEKLVYTPGADLTAITPRSEE